jgi:hypothetical protein
MQGPPNDASAALRLGQSAGKYRNKAESYRYVVTELGAHLPPRKTISRCFLLQLINKQKEFIPVQQLHKATVQGLTIEDVTKHIDTKNLVRKYLPDKVAALKKIPNDFIFDVLRSLYTETFDAYVAERIKQENEKLALGQEQPDGLKAASGASTSQGAAVYNRSSFVGYKLTRARRSKPGAAVEEDKGSLAPEEALVRAAQAAGFPPEKLGRLLRERQKIAKSLAGFPA